MLKKWAKRARKYLYDQKISFRRWRTRTKRELNLIALGLGHRLLLLGVGPLARHLPSGKFSFLPRLRFLIGPTNSANQGVEWSGALNRAGFRTQSVRISTDPSAEWFTTDIAISREEWLKPPVRSALAQRLAAQADVLLLESLSPIFRLENARDGRHQVLEDIELARHIGKKVGVIFHGSDIRDVDLHAARIPFSPFASNRPEVADLRSRVAANKAILPTLQKMGIPLFVSTLDLLKDVPSAQWLPVVVDFPKFISVADRSPIHSAEKLRVLYLPSESWLKSSEIISPILEKLSTEKVIEWVKSPHLSHEEIPALLAKVDLVIDQLFGATGVFTAEALAAGRLVMGYIEEQSFDSAPIINVTPETLEAAIREVAAQRPLAKGGVEFAQRWHDGRESASVIARAFGWRSN